MIKASQIFNRLANARIIHNIDALRAMQARGVATRAERFAAKRNLTGLLDKVLGFKLPKKSVKGKLEFYTPKLEPKDGFMSNKELLRDWVKTYKSDPEFRRLYGPGDDIVKGAYYQGFIEKLKSYET